MLSLAFRSLPGVALRQCVPPAMHADNRGGGSLVASLRDPGATGCRASATRRWRSGWPTSRRPRSRRPAPASSAFARHGVIDVPATLAACEAHGLAFDSMRTAFLGGRGPVSTPRRRHRRRARRRFAFVARNARPAAFFRIPTTA
ncbi:MAG TPA: hypothetical protein VIG88_12700 [Lysobacter sp.]